MKIRRFYHYIPWIFCLFLLHIEVRSQGASYESFGDGIQIHANDSTFHTSIGVRVQTLYTGVKDLETSDWDENVLIRRARLKFDGYVLDPRIVYKFEFGISNRDISGALPENSQASNIILDAVIKWNFFKNWELWAGQTKLPGNRERVISSQKMQFVDRSLVNASFNLDRDIGLQLHHYFSVNNIILRQAFAISKGEGRNITISNPESGRELTGRLEILPFGAFSQSGDYFGSDLAREKRPKLSIGITGDYNHNAVRARGNLGSFMTDTTGERTYLTTNFETLILDGVFKYRGLSVSSEYILRESSNQQDNFGYGSGIFGAIGYLFPSNIEIAGRYTNISPGSGLTSINQMKEYTLGLSWYIKAHNFKVQSDISYLDQLANDAITFRLQCELAF
ncbi:MAG: porin [Bacteroidota bacterium]